MIHPTTTSNRCPVRQQRLQPRDRLYDWARTPIYGINFPDSNYWLLARRSRTDPTDVAYYPCHAPAYTSLAELVTVAGTRWTIEEIFQTSKGQTGLTTTRSGNTPAGTDITLSMLAHALLTVTRFKKGTPKIRHRHPHRPHRPGNPPAPDPTNSGSISRTRTSLSPAPSGDAATNNAPNNAPTTATTTGHADIVHKCDCSSSHLVNVFSVLTAPTPCSDSSAARYGTVNLWSSARSPNRLWILTNASGSSFWRRAVAFS